MRERGVEEEPDYEVRFNLSRKRTGESDYAPVGAAALPRACDASFERWRSGVIRTTFQISPSFSIAQMTHADGSSSSRPRPWTAERGKAWWLWCHASPRLGSASQNTFVDSSSTSKRRRPKKWQ